MENQSGRSTTGTSQDQSSVIHYNTSAVQVGNQIRDGDEFVLLVRSKQGQGFQAWSSNDQSTTPQLIQQATQQLNFNRQPQTA